MEFGLLVGVLLLLGFALGLLAAGWMVSAKYLANSPTRIRLLGAAVGAFALHGVVFYGLISTGQYHFGGMLIGGIGSLVGATWWTREVNHRASFGRDYRDVAEFVGWSFRGWRLLATGPVVAVVGGNFLRALVIPPLAWDSLTYHLVRPVLWMQASGLSAYQAPGAWEKYRLMMPLGDGMAGWTILSTHSDVLVPLPYLAGWVTLLLATYTIARSWGASKDHALLAALAAGLLPAVSQAIFVAYVDNIVAALVVTSAALFTDAERRGNRGALVLAVVALGAAFAVKKSALPYCVFGAGLAGVLIWRDHRDHAGWVGSACVIGLVATAIPPAVYLWVTEGTPIFPVELSVFGVTLIEGGTPLVTGDVPSLPFGTVVERFFWTGYGPFWLSHVNFGPFAPVWFVLGIWGAVGLWRENRGGLLSLGAFAVPSLLLLMRIARQPGLTGLNVARYAVVGPILLIGLAAVRKQFAIRCALILGIWVQLVYLAPTHWGAVDARATGQFVLMATPFFAVGAALFYWARTQQPTGRLIAVIAGGFLLVAICVTVTLEPIRRLYRWDIYQEAADGSAYANIPVTGNHATGFQSASIWRKLDRPDRPYRIAVTTGWNGRGTNWFVYPFFGSRFQNEITYVPVTKDGAFFPVDEKHQRTAEASYEAWRRRLVEQDVDFVATLAPRPIEVHAMEVHDESFSLVEVGGRPGNRLFVFTPAADR